MVLCLIDPLLKGIIIAYDAIHSIQQAKTNIMLIKFDVKKAYDHVRRPFLIKVMEKFGFHPNWTKWVCICIETPRSSILVNGSLHGFFSSTRGIRQGDPLSPFLFIIMAEALGHMITKNRMVGRWKGICIARGTEAIMHTQFADDTLLMGEASLRGLNYQNSIGQVLSNFRASTELA